MINRRHLRVKALQLLYACFKSDERSLEKWVKELLFSFEKTYDLYLFQLSLFQELRYQADQVMEDRKKKRLPSEEDLNPSLKFMENKALTSLEENPSLRKMLNTRKINWGQHQDIMRKLFLAINASPEYKKYVTTPGQDFAQDVAFLVKIYREFLADAEMLGHVYEEKSIYWLDDLELVNAQVLKTLQSVKEDPEAWVISPLFHDEDDKEFVLELFRKVINNSKEYEDLVSAKTKNWDVERIAQMDILIMKMAICELTSFPNIPVKVTLNEYIDLGKYYSTPRSHVFINGVLDKIVAELKGNGQIRKTGRGLME